MRHGVPGQDCNTACTALLSLVDVVELVVASARTSVAPEKLLTAVERFPQYLER